MPKANSIEVHEVTRPRDRHQDRVDGVNARLQAPIHAIRCPQCGARAERKRATGEVACPNCGTLWVR